jgi:hypothetical protein
MKNPVLKKFKFTKIINLEKNGNRGGNAENKKKKKTINVLPLTQTT